MKEVLEFLNQCGVYYLATMDGDQPRVRPFGAACIFEDKLYFTTSNQKAVYQQLLRNPKVEISGMAGGRWIRLSGKLTTDPRREAKAAMLEANPVLKKMYGLDDGKFEVLSISDAKADICSFTGAPVHIEF